VTDAPTTVAAPHDPEAQAPTRDGSLLRAETHRFVSRRFIRWLLLVALVAYALLMTFVGLTQFAKTDASRLADAQRRADVAVAETQGFYEQCLEDPNRPADVPVEEFCGPPPEESLAATDFLEPPPFVLAEQLDEGALALGVVSALLAFLIGATYVGAEWSSKSMVALLFWEPRRLRVMGVKLGVTAAAAVLLAVAVQVVWWATAELLAATRGERGRFPADFWPDLLGQQARTVLFVVLTALLGFGIANLVRNTGAALGVGFVYFAVVETAVRIFRPRWQEWLLTDNAAALLLPDGGTIYIYEDMAPGEDVQQATEIVMSNVHGGLVLGIVTAVVVVVGVVLFKRRDLH
jgi:hypothetical protein